jgi:hypothetical protein
MNEKLSLAIPPTLISNEKPFDGDLLDRAKLATRLADYIDRLRVGAVLGIDAPWGEGKTWFGKNWANYLRTSPRDHRVVFIDAFAQDYVEDPFLLLAGEIAPALQDDKGLPATLQESAVGVARLLLPVGTKALLNLAGRLVLGSAELSEDLKEAAKSVSEGTVDAASKWIEKKLEDYTQEKRSLDYFRDELAKFAAAQKKPVVVFIDELDRCRPTFAVQLIERIKHFFDVPNLVFVLLLNREQLEHAIRGVYGRETDATTYLGKFVHLFLRLPRAGTVANSDDLVRNFVNNVLSRYGLSTDNKVCRDFSYELSQWAMALEMSLRDIERACAYFVIANPQKTAIVAYLIALKLKLPALYLRLSKGDRNAHEEARQLVSKFIHVKDVSSMTWPDLYFQAIYDLHALQLGVTTQETPVYNEHAAPLFGSRVFDRNASFARIFDKLDLPVEVS